MQLTLINATHRRKPARGYRRAYTRFATFSISSLTADFQGDRDAGAMMIFTKQNRSYSVILSAAKDLGAHRARSFAALRMTIPVLVGNIHDCAPTNYPEGRRTAAT